MKLTERIEEIEKNTTILNMKPNLESLAHCLRFFVSEVVSRLDGLENNKPKEQEDVESDDLQATVSTHHLKLIELEEQLNILSKLVIKNKIPNTEEIEEVQRYG